MEHLGSNWNRVIMIMVQYNVSLLCITVYVSLIVAPCRGHEDCCTVDRPCPKGHGHCDLDDECVGDLECGTNNCNGSWFAGDNCCFDSSSGLLCDKEAHSVPSARSNFVPGTGFSPVPEYFVAYNFSKQVRLTLTNSEVEAGLAEPQNTRPFGPGTSTKPSGINITHIKAITFWWSVFTDWFLAYLPQDEDQERRIVVKARSQPLPKLTSAELSFHYICGTNDSVPVEVLFF